MNVDFWKRCYEARCVIVPVMVYSDYVDGNLHPSKLVGLRYAALQFEGDAVGPHYWFMIDDGNSGAENLFESPLQALEAYERRAGPTPAEPR
jgi:hypothetical protein